MRRLVVSLALLCAVSVSLSAQKAGDAVRFASRDLGGAEVTDALFAESRITMVNIWGTFCGPCIREMPDLARLSGEYKAKGVRVVGVPIDIVDRNGVVMAKTKADGEAIIARTGADYTHIVPTKEMLGGFLKGVQAVPTTIFVDSSGRQIGAPYMGARSYKDWQRIIDELLAGQG